MRIRDPIIAALLSLSLASQYAAFGADIAKAAPSVGELVSAYIERYFDMYPTRATEAGWHAKDAAIGDFSPARLAEWIEFNHQTRSALRALAPSLKHPAAFEDRLDADVLTNQVEREILNLATLKRAESDPLFWTEPLANATVFLLVRDDLNRTDALAAARQRVSRIPALVRAARHVFAVADPKTVSPEHAQLALAQIKSLAAFYRTGFAQAFPANQRAAVQAEADEAAKALSAFAPELESLAAKATGRAQLGERYAEVFRLGTGLSEPVSAVLARAEQALVAKKKETAEYARSVYPEVAGGEAPADDAEVIRRALAAIAEDHDTDLDSYLADWRRNVVDVEKFVRDHDVMTLRDPLTLKLEVSPAYFTGQSVGGVYAAGPWSPDASTILFLPVPRTGATPEEAAAFYHDFNRGFNRMIVSHELLPGHYTQLKDAAHHPRKIRALFANGVYAEGWGTFCERLLLDLGFGNPRARLAHLKKQLENIARTIVDIRVHTMGMTEAQVRGFVTGDAFQGEQLARNMWMRTLTSDSQITTYFLGYDQVNSLYQDVRKARGTAFALRDFTDGMMKLGPVPVSEYRAQMLGDKIEPRP